jgi:hypothetical protein
MTVPHNLNKFSGRGSIVGAIFVGCFTTSPSGGYIAVLGRVFVESTDRRACATHQFPDPTSSPLSELERYFFERYLLSKMVDSYLFSVLSWDVVVETLMEYDDNTHDERIRSSIGRVSGRLFVNINDTDFKISMTQLMVHQIPKRLSSEYVLD